MKVFTREAPCLFLKLLLPFGFAFLGTVACDEVPKPEVANLPPVAQAWVPQIWQIQEEVEIDASESFDPDGRIVRMIANFGDGNEEVERQDGRFAHLFPSAGSFSVRIDVFDDDGDVATVSGQIVVVERLDEPICSCERPCFEAGICASGACYDGVVSDETFLLERTDALRCELDVEDADAGRIDAGE